ncbi:Uncharacterised protein [Lacrimispora sphenoides]|uniref:Uncharacterized protein n=1 Tax=Lacrimispora sphenoides JCM 1415 TaxID=1297793 RepID=A0ABY1CBF3_9FIRM|nr:hypothetical protein SAMN02745906_2559 [[Clostridium] sphenoides JCM 1415]SUY51907.1 Uncharacterised protein [Lacrimispora sphenoides]
MKHNFITSRDYEMVSDMENAGAPHKKDVIARLRRLFYAFVY